MVMPGASARIAMVCTSAMYEGDCTSANASVTEVEACWMVVGAFFIGGVQWDKNSVLHDVHVMCALSECWYNATAVAGFLSLAERSY